MSGRPVQITARIILDKHAIGAVVVDVGIIDVDMLLDEAGFGRIRLDADALGAVVGNLVVGRRAAGDRDVLSCEAQCRGIRFDFDAVTRVVADVHVRERNGLADRSAIVGGVYDDRTVEVVIDHGVGD